MNPAKEILFSFRCVAHFCCNNAIGQLRRPFYNNAAVEVFKNNFSIKSHCSISNKALPCATQRSSTGVAAAGTKKIIHLIAILFFVVLSTVAAAQQRISVNAALDTALRNNLQLRSSDLQIQQARVLSNTGLNIPGTGVFVENEDISPQDPKGILKIGVSQNFDWPGLYKAQKNLLQKQVGSFEASRRIRELEIRREVQSTYYQIWYLQSKQQLWKRLDSLYSSFAQAASLRVKTGESAGLDSISAQAKANEIGVQLSILQRDIQTQQEILKRVLNTTLYYLPHLQTVDKVPASFAADSLNNHPLLNLQQQNIAIANAEMKLQQQSNKPNFDSRFFSQRLHGVSNPYSGFSVTVGIPLFGRSFYKNKIRAAQIERNYQQSIYDYERLSLTTAYSGAMQQLQKDEELLSFYETTGLAQAEVIIKAANLAYRGGEIGFSELSQFLTQAIDIQKAYLDVLNQYNQSAIQLNYYLNR